MPLPKDIQFITFDCYGTLIDWETGVYEAFQKEADRDGFTIDRDVLIPRFIEIQRKIQSGSYELYAEVLRRTAVQVAEDVVEGGQDREAGEPGGVLRGLEVEVAAHATDDAGVAVDRAMAADVAPAVDDLAADVGAGRRVPRRQRETEFGQSLCGAHTGGLPGVA